MPMRFTDFPLFRDGGEPTGGSGGEGAAGEGGSGSGTQGTEGTPQAGNGGTQDGGAGGSDELSKVRAEAAKYRTQLREVQERLKQFEDAGKTELEKVQGDLTKATEKVTTLESRLRKNMVAVLAGDIGIVKEARSDAAALLDWDAMDDPTDEKVVEKALRDLVKARPYLTGKVAGGADGGAGNGRGAESGDMNASIRQMAGRR